MTRSVRLGLLHGFGAVTMPIWAAVVPNEVALKCDHVRSGVAHCVIDRFSLFERITAVLPQVHGARVADYRSRQTGSLRLLYLETPGDADRPLTRDFSASEGALRRMETAVKEVCEGKKAQILERASNPGWAGLVALAALLVAAFGLWVYKATRRPWA